MEAAAAVIVIGTLGIIATLGTLHFQHQREELIRYDNLKREIYLRLIVAGTDVNAITASSLTINSTEKLVEVYQDVLEAMNALEISAPQGMYEPAVDFGKVLAKLFKHAVNNQTTRPDNLYSEYLTAYQNFTRACRDDLRIAGNWWPTKYKDDDAPPG